MVVESVAMSQERNSAGGLTLMCAIVAPGRDSLGQREANMAGKDKGGRSAKTPAAKTAKEKKQSKQDKKAKKGAIPT